MDRVGVVFSFRVDPKEDENVEKIMREIFDAMAVEEFPTEDVLTYTLFRDPEQPGRWVMFECFTQQGSDRHCVGPLMMEAGKKLEALMIDGYERVLLDPVIVLGCGESVVTSRCRDEE